jgi:hypothetical protein
VTGNAFAAAAQDKPQAPPGVLPHLTVDTYAEAVACGRKGPDCAVTPYELCPSQVGGRYSARIATPYSRVASAVLDEVRSGKPSRGMDRGAANRWGVGVFVYPAENSAKAEAIQRLEIRREGRIIKPTTSTVGPITIVLSDGSSKQLARGFFAFAADTFVPTTDLDVVFIGAIGEETCRLDRAQLAAMR